MDHRFEFPDLNDATRRYMLEELDHDEKAGGLYVGKRLNDTGRRVYPTLLRDALREGDPYSLADRLGAVPGDFWIAEIIAKNGRRSPTPETAPITLAEGQFNRFYMRALARRALEEGKALRIDRLKPVDQPRSDSSALIGDQIDPEELLEEQRVDPDAKPFDAHLGNPNSGLSVRLA